MSEIQRFNEAKPKNVKQIPFSLYSHNARIKKVK